MQVLFMLRFYGKHFQENDLFSGVWLWQENSNLLQMIEEEEVRMLRKEMIPRAQLMPFFDKPFFPQR